MTGEPEPLASLLARAGFVSAEEEAGELTASAAGDPALLEALVERRLTGEPLAWITGGTQFCDVTIGVTPGVYVPRWLTEPLAQRAVERLPETGTAIDVCCGSGAIAAVLKHYRPRARVLATDIDETSVACARANGVDATVGDLFDPLPSSLDGTVDVVIGVVPYVPTDELELLQRDTFAFESPLAYDGGDDGTGLLRRVVAASPRFLRPGGALLLELGGDQAELLRSDLTAHGFGDISVMADEDGDVRGIEAILGA